MRVLPLAAVVFLAGCQATSTSTPTTSPTPLARPAIDAIVAAFTRHQVVAVGESHGSQVQHAFLRSLLTDPRLIGVIDDVAVEFGSARHQGTMDRYVGGGDVSEAELSLVWTDTTQQSGVWDEPIYRQLFELAREQNLGRARDDRLRVLLGDPPIDWDGVTDVIDCDDQDPSCLDFWMMGRDEHFADVVRSESLERGRRALVIAGSGHILRNPGAESPISLTDLLDATHPGSVWALLPVDRSNVQVVGALVEVGAPTDTEPRVVELAGTSLGAIAVSDVFDRGTVTCDDPPCETAVPLPLRAAVDAVLLL